MRPAEITDRGMSLNCWVKDMPKTGVHNLKLFVDIVAIPKFTLETAFDLTTFLIAVMYARGDEICAATVQGLCSNTK